MAGTSRVWRVLGILLGTATCISIIKNGFSIELSGLPEKVFAQYTWLRDTLFEPVVWVLRYFGLTMPWWVKDVIVAYGLVAAAHWKSIDWSKKHRPSIIVSIVLGWPIVDLMEWHDHRKRRNWLAHEFRHTDTDDVSDYKQFSTRVILDEGRVLRNHRLLVLWHLVKIGAYTAAFFLWNYLQNVFGPGA